jgi:hypothetical protein
MGYKRGWYGSKIAFLGLLYGFIGLFGKGRSVRLSDQIDGFKFSNNLIKQTMKIDIENIKKWSAIYEHGDYVKISNQSGIGVLTIQNAFRYGRASSNTIIAIKEYYDAKQIVIDNLKSKTNETTI